MSHRFRFVIVITFVASYVVIGTVETPNTTGVNMIVRTAELVAVASIIGAVHVIIFHVARPVLNPVDLSSAILILPHNASREEHEQEGNEEDEPDHNCHLSKQTNDEARSDGFHREKHYFVFS